MKKALVIGGLVVAGLAAAFVLTRKGEEPPPEVYAVRVAKARVEERVRATGHVEPSNRVRVSVNLTGELMRLHAREGQQVAKGDLLAEIDLGSASAVMRQRQANVAAARSAATGAAVRLQELDRQVAETRALKEKGVATGNDLARLASERRLAQAALREAQARVTQAEAESDELKVRVGQSQIMAPMAGTVISVEKEAGERVRGSDMVEDVLLVLAPLDAMEVAILVTERDVVNLEVGAPAEITMAALGAQKIPGKVMSIAASATVKDRGTAMETTHFLVKLAFATVPARLRPGMTAQVDILARAKEDVLAVPFEAVAARPLGAPDAKEVVFVAEGAIARQREVHTGLAGDQVLEVLDGLKEGEVVLAGPYQLVHQEIWDGAPIRVAPMAAETPPAAKLVR